LGDLGSKKIGSNYQRLLQISASGMVADGTGSLVSLNISGSEYYTSGSGDGEQEVLKGLTVTGAILPEGSGSWDLGSEDHPFKDLYISSASMKLINVGQLARVKALGGEHYNVSKSLYISEFNKEDVDNLKKGISLKPDRYTQTARVVDHIQTDNYMHLNSSDRIYFNVGGKGMFDLDQDENYIKYGLASPYLGYISPQHIFEGNITASGDISASGTIYADKFESPGSSSVSINDNLIVSGNISFPDGYILGSRSNQILIGSQSKTDEEFITECKKEIDFQMRAANEDLAPTIYFHGMIEQSSSIFRDRDNSIVPYYYIVMDYLSEKKGWKYVFPDDIPEHSLKYIYNLVKKTGLINIKDPDMHFYFNHKLQKLYMIDYGNCEECDLKNEDNAMNCINRMTKRLHIN